MIDHSGSLQMNNFRGSRDEQFRSTIRAWYSQLRWVEAFKSPFDFDYRRLKVLSPPRLRVNLQ
ncbi:hypothetical protein Syun_010392 [Stephania yunnanensis]|uniref:Uncharacterized protein n=1 Tax=Stephania yunnanensis TaxID=152371 RepID=A0AAP0KGF4_9MAGN